MWGRGEPLAPGQSPISPAREELAKVIQSYSVSENVTLVICNSYH
jgi:hypothetical protein